MKLLTVKQIRDWDAYTIRHEPVTSLDLMERAGRACTEHFLKSYSLENKFTVFCGQGNNGGDGLVIARLLSGYGYGIEVYVVRHSDRPSRDFISNLDRLGASGDIPVREIRSRDDLPVLQGKPLIVDALLGSGISKPLRGLLAETVDHINRSGQRVISIDIPSGLPADIEQWDPDGYRSVISADTTLTFQLPKTSFLFPDTGDFCGEFKVLDIGLHPDFLREATSAWNYADEELVHSLIRPRKKFDHKGRFGHALLVAGS
ncbi:MAG TPA: NAD(P)H-hydrate epimerase, partial [Anseongella sp.]|nr:NAD(P)H-hydrate epimerase [Anseongella sp.]